MTEVKHETEIGDRIPDGTIYAGDYEGKPLYTTPTIYADDYEGRPLNTTPSSYTPGLYTFNKAAECAGVLNRAKFLGHDDWRVPMRGELNVLFENRSKGRLAGTFNETGAVPAGWYWSASSDHSGVGGWAQRFSDGDQFPDDRDDALSLRLVR